MPLWTQTGNQLIERRNSFLRDLAHGFDVTYQVVEIDGGTFDPNTDSVSAGTPITVKTVYSKSLSIVPMKSLDDGGGDGQLRGKLMVAGGHRIQGISPEQSIVGRMHIRVPLNFEAVYLVDGQSYKLDRILASVSIGAQPFWNDVVLTRA